MNNVEVITLVEDGIMNIIRKNLNMTRLQAMLIGCSGFLIYFAYDTSFNMQVLFPIIAILGVSIIKKNKGLISFNKQNVEILYLMMIYVAATVINCIFDWKTIDEKSFIRIGYTLFILFYYYIITSGCFNREDIKKILYLNASAGLFIALLIIKNWCGGAKGKISLISFFNVSIEENYTGALLAFVAVLSFLMLRFEKKKLNKIFILLVMGFCVFAVCLTGSRAALISIVLSLIVMGIQYLFARKVSFFKKIFWIALCIVICIVLYTQLEHILPSFLYNRLFTNSLDDSSNADRLVLWKNGFNGFLNRPFLGYGVGNFNYYVRLIFPQHKVVVAHNSFLDILIDVGIIGFGVFAVMIYKNIKCIFKEGKVFIPLFVCFLFTAFIVGGERTFFFWNDITILTLISKCFSDKLVKSTDELFD